MGFWGGLIIGIFAGGIVSAFITSLLCANHDDVIREEREYEEDRNEY